ncbi:wall-associated receptor kinase-like 15 [Arachis hypogaea]|uniref:Wall-associated receptor kinase galacturonan-binding domain-containing protein n=1 Tax=Arachis hypogaea TaxID=3818 RepID=A0A444ZNN3_ARAHY|nr:wall-associated receptor kinase-like 15 [Arachis hypogaea]RYR15722.1 hypothetical protein Ahy_B04g072638 [Arachis hypogaea]
MTIIEHFLLVLITTILITLCVNAVKDCQDCGHIKVPYPLSTSPNCGDPNYKIRCNSGTLWFDTINGSSYIITSINPTLQRLVIQPPGLANNTCMSRDFKNEGMWLDTNSPFNITSSNTLILMNCSLEILTMLFNCSSTSICHKYIEEGNAVISKNCGVTSHASKLCCDVKTGGSATSHRIRVREDRCAAYASFPNLDPSLPVSMWQPGVEIEWQLPAEPSCKVAGDCLDVANSRCLPDPVAGGEGKCLCNAGFQWDPVNGKCQDTKCQHGRGCKLRKKSPLIGDIEDDRVEVYERIMNSDSEEDFEATYEAGDEDEDGGISDPEDGEFRIGIKYSSRKSVVIAIRSYTIYRGVNYNII